MMNWKGLKLEEAIAGERARLERKSPDTTLAAFKALLKADDKADALTHKRILKGSATLRKIDLNRLDPTKIYTEAQIKALCCRYRLRFLSTRYFKGEIPYEAISAVRALQKEQGETLDNFKIIAPAPMFNLEQRDKDPLLMLPLGKGMYYLVHKWGKDLHPMRRLLVLPFRNFKSLLATVALVALTVVLSIPDSVIMGPYDKSSGALRIIFFFYLFIAFSGLTALYGFSRLKNFNENLWDSRYLD
jgi:hypothetical protein